MNIYEYFMENLKSRTVLDKFRSVTNFVSQLYNLLSFAVLPISLGALVPTRIHAEMDHPKPRFWVPSWPLGADAGRL